MYETRSLASCRRWGNSWIVDSPSTRWQIPRCLSGISLPFHRRERLQVRPRYSRRVFDIAFPSENVEGRSWWLQRGVQYMACAVVTFSESAHWWFIGAPDLVNNPFAGLNKATASNFFPSDRLSNQLPTNRGGF